MGYLHRWIVGLRDGLLLPDLFHATSQPVIGHSSVSARRDTEHDTGSSTADAPVMSGPGSLQESILWTILYSDIFDYPLRKDEVYRFLVAPGGPQADVERAIDDLLAHGHLESDGIYICRAGRSSAVATRLRRGVHAQQAWKRARVYARLIWMLPYVRMVAVTGALAMDNVEASDDIDFFIVVEPGRLWLTRGMILVVVKLARTRGDTVCPNFILSTRALALEQRDLYTAHELVQMIPMHGGEVAESVWTGNAWYRDFLPNGYPRYDHTPDQRLPTILLIAKSLGQALLNLPIGTAIEQWEQRRKIAKLSRAVPSHVVDTCFTADVCKGHAGGHRSEILLRWTSEVARQSRECGLSAPHFKSVVSDSRVDLS